MSSIIVLGAGRVGSAIAFDLQACGHAITVVDKNSSRLREVEHRFNNITTQELDVADQEQLHLFLKDKDLVINAVPGVIGFKTLKSIIMAGKDVVDISFFPENAFILHELAENKKVTAVVDCGVAPGMNNIILGRLNEEMDVKSFRCMVGGLPKKRKWPFYYKAPFSPVDVIEEYMRPARIKENDKITVKEPLSGRTRVDFDAVGTLVACNTDGLRTLLHTMSDIPDMKEQTLRYPGHIEYILALKETGFFNSTPITLRDGTSISPKEVTTRLLEDEWYLEEEEEEITLMRIIIEGNDTSGKECKVTYSLHDEYCVETGISSMARTTGYTATAVVNLIIENALKDSGIIPPEYIGKNKSHFEDILEYLSKRDIVYTQQ